MGINNLSNHFKKHYFLLFGVVILMFITSVTLITVKSNNIDDLLIKKDFTNVRNSVKFGVLEVELPNFYYINDGMLTNHIKAKNTLNLVRWIHKYKKRLNIDGGIIISKNGNLLAKSDFIKTPFNSKMASIINKSLEGDLISSVEIIGLDSFDESLKFEFLKKSAYSTGSAKEMSLSLVKAFPIYDNNDKIIASFVTISFINGNNPLLDEIVGNIAYDEAGIIIDGGNVVKREFVSNDGDEVSLFNKLKSKKTKKDITDPKSEMIIIPLYGFDGDLNAGLYVKLSSIENAESLSIFYVQNILFLLLGLAIFVYSLKILKKTSEDPYKKMVSIMYNMSNGDFKFPLLSRFYLQSMFKNEFNALMKISKRVMNNEDPRDKE